MTLTLPPILWPMRSTFWIENASRSGGASITGAEQVVVSDAGRWRASAVFAIVGVERALAWRAFVHGLDGRAQVFEIGPHDRFRPANINGRRVSNVDASRLGCDGVLFDLSGLGQTPQTYATLAAPAALGTTRIALTAEPLWMIPRRGMYFGIGSRLYIATGVYRADEASPWTVDFRPRLREAATVGARVITDRPVCRMRLASDDVARLDLEFQRIGQAALEMTEAI